MLLYKKLLLVTFGTTLVYIYIYIYIYIYNTHIIDDIKSRLSQCHCGHHKLHMEWPRIKPGPPVTAW